MTEAAYQAARVVMRKANWMLGQITSAKGAVAKWTKIEAVHRQNLAEGQANGAKKMLDKSMKVLDKRRQKFAELMLPDNNLPDAIESVPICPICDNPIGKGETCANCNQ